MLQRAICSFAMYTMTKSTIPCTKHLLHTFEKYNKSTVALSNDNPNKYTIPKSIKIEDSIYKTSEIVKNNYNCAKPRIIGRYILTRISDKISENQNRHGEIHLQMHHKDGFVVRNNFQRQIILY